MKSLPQGYRAIVLGSSGGIGSAFLDALRADLSCSEVIGISRKTHVGFNLSDEKSIQSAAETVTGPVHLIIDATGFLGDGLIAPEKSLRKVEAVNLAKLFEINAIGPVLLIKHFSHLLPKDGRSIFATLSARVGSIGDNRLGGWYSYRASKAALNMLLRSAAIEISRTNPESVLASLHPGTVKTALSEPFSQNRNRLLPGEAAARLLEVLDRLGPEDTGSFWDYKNQQIEW